MKWVKRFLKFLILSLIILFTMLYFFQEKLIFHSSELPQDYEYPFTTRFEELFLKASDGAILNGLHFKQESPKGVILYCHGNAGALDNWGAWAQELSNRYNYDVVVWDYRGYGKSSGKRRQDLMLNDGFLFYEYCKIRYSESKISVYGRSLGGFFATHITKNSNPSQLILESTPTGLLDVARNQYPYLPAGLLLKYKFQNVQNIELIRVPTHIIHGTADNLIPFEHGEKLFGLSAAETKKFYPISGGGHNDLVNFEKAYFEVLNAILTKL